MKNLQQKRVFKIYNYDTMNVSRVSDIPIDYMSVMSVPLTFLDKYYLKQFKIIDTIVRYLLIKGKTKESVGKYLTEINGKRQYTRILIKKENQRRLKNNKLKWEI